MTQTQTATQTLTFEVDEAAEARSQLYLDEALEAFAKASRAAITNPLCPRCVSPYGQWRGYRTRARDGQVIHRRQCTTCTKWYGKSCWSTPW
jgi:hypothetical protein